MSRPLIWRTLLVLTMAAICFANTTSALTAAPLAIEPPVFSLGFKALADQAADVVGQPLENEHYGPNGDSLQQTTKGLMVWRKADNWTAFTNGSRTWVNGPYGVMERGNDERFDWESLPPASTPVVAPPVYVDNTPSDYDLSHGETIVRLQDGSAVLRIRLSNRNHYWTAADIQVTATVLDRTGRVVTSSVAAGGSPRLGPQQSDVWEYDLPNGSDLQPAVPTIAFRWVAPGG